MEPMHFPRSTVLASPAITAYVAVAQPCLVTLNVIATDAQGHTVSGLIAADLRITCQSKPVPPFAFRNETTLPTAP
jgi:hypothetical protein